MRRQKPKLAREQQAIKEQGQGLGGPWSEVLLLPHYYSQPHPMGLLFIPPPAEKLKGGKEAGEAEAGGSGAARHRCSQPRQTAIYHLDQGTTRVLISSRQC